jgi:hypothetical protein
VTTKTAIAGRRPLSSLRAMSLLMLAGAAVLLGACESQNALTGNIQPQATLTPPPAPKVALPRVAVAPMIGAPDAVAKQLVDEFSNAVSKDRAQIVPAGQTADLTIRGYVVAAKDRANTKVSYIWDVTDAQSKRLHRISGEEVVNGQTPRDPWAAVNSAVIVAVAQKSAQSFGTWLQANPVSGSAVATAPSGVGGVSPVQTAATPPPASDPAPTPAVATARPTVQPVSAPAAGSGTLAIVPPVTGAPGDGAVSLTRALQGELTKSGVALVTAANANTFRVEGEVKVQPPAGGKQAIQIDWNVKDPQGKKLGTVTQKNEIPEGSLDGAWGRVADAAAAAAAQGIVKLLPQR